MTWSCFSVPYTLCIEKKNNDKKKIKKKKSNYLLILVFLSMHRKHVHYYFEYTKDIPTGKLGFMYSNGETRTLKLCPLEVYSTVTVFWEANFTQGHIYVEI